LDEIQIAHHFGANAGTGGEKEIRHIDVSIQGIFGDQLTQLIAQGKRIDGMDFGISRVIHGNPFCVKFR
jgi:hypothetical protein